MCNYGSSSVKSLSQKNLAIYSLSYQKNYSIKVKAHKNCLYEMRKRKEQDKKKQTLDAGVYPVIRLATKAHLHPRC